MTKIVTKVERKVIEKPKLQEEPKAPELKLNKVRYVYEPNTIWVTVDGKVLRNKEDGEKPKDNFDGYEYVRTEKDKDGNTRHIYKPVEKPQEQPKMKTIWETVNGKVLRNWEDGEKPKDRFDGYEYVRTDVDKDGNIHHIYKPVENPTKKVTTIWVTVTGQVLRERRDGTLPKDSFKGYEYVETRVDENGNTTHIFKPVVKSIKTIWETVDRAKTLRAWQDAEKAKDKFDGYEFVRTVTDEDGNIHHLYQPVKVTEKPVEKPVEKPIAKQAQPQTAKELPKTGDAGTMTSLLGGLFTMGGLLGFKRRKNHKK